MDINGSRPCVCQGSGTDVSKFTLADAHKHATKCGYTLEWVDPNPGFKPPKPRLTKTEQEYGFILEALQNRGVIVEYRFEGISLSWGADPETGKPMWYTPDFIVWMANGQTELHEVKGGHIFAKDLIRFKGCRAEWGLHFRFALHQKKNRMWRRLL